MAELEQPFRISQQAVSKHLAYLQRAELVRKRRVGRKQICELAPGPIREVAAWAEDYRRHWESAFSRLHELLEQQLDEPRSKER